MSNVDVHVVVDVTGFLRTGARLRPGGRARHDGRPSCGRHPNDGPGHAVGGRRDPPDRPARRHAVRRHGGGGRARTSSPPTPSYPVGSRCSRAAARCRSSRRSTSRPAARPPTSRPSSSAPNGHVCVKASQAVDLVIDLFGAMTPPTGSLAERLSFTGRTVFPDFTPDGSDYAVICDAERDRPRRSTSMCSPGVSVRVNGVAHARRRHRRRRCARGH